MERLGGAFLAGAGFPFQQHRGVGGGGLLDQREGGAHRHRLAHQRPQLGPLRERLGDALLLQPHPQHRPPQAQLGAVAQPGLGDAGAVHPASVARLQIADAGRAVVEQDLAMEARDGLVGEHHVVARLLADRRTRFRQLAHPLPRRIEQAQPAHHRGRRGPIRQRLERAFLLRHGPTIPPRKQSAVEGGSIRSFYSSSARHMYQLATLR